MTTQHPTDQAAYGGSGATAVPGAGDPGGTPGAGGPSEGRSLGDIVGDIANDLTTLVKQELDLAKTEAKQEAVKAGKGVGLFSGAGIAAHLMLVFLSLALTFLLDSWMHTALAALIVAVLWGIAAGVMALLGKSEMKSIKPPLENTQQTLKEDVAWAKELKK